MKEGIIMFETLKKKIFFITSIITYALTIVLSHESFSGVHMKTGKINVDGVLPLVFFATLSTIMFALWVCACGDLSNRDNSFIIAFTVSLIGIVGSGLSYWRFALLNEAANVMSYHGASGWDYSTAERETFYKWSSDFKSSASVWLILSIVLWVVTALAIALTINQMKKAR